MAPPLLVSTLHIITRAPSQSSQQLFAVRGDALCPRDERDGGHGRGTVGKCEDGVKAKDPPASQGGVAQEQGDEEGQENLWSA